MEENKRRMTREEIISELLAAWEEELNHTSIADLKAMIEKLDGEKVDVIDENGQIISALKSKDGYEEESESGNIQEEAEPYGYIESTNDEEWDDLEEESDDEIFPDRLFEKNDHPYDHKEEDPLEENKEDKAVEDVGTGVPSELYYHISFLYVLDAISKFGENEPITPTRIQDILQKEMGRRQDDTELEFWQKEHPLFERHILKKKPTKNSAGDSYNLYPSIKTIKAGIMAFLYAHSSQAYEKELKERKIREKERKENQNRPEGQKKLVKRYPYTNSYRAIKSSECRLIAFLILICGFISKEEKMKLLTALMRLSPRMEEDQIHDMYKYGEQNLKMKSGREPTGHCIYSLDETMRGTSLLEPGKNLSEIERQYFSIACRCMEERSTSPWMLFNPYRWKWKENGKLVVEGAVSYTCRMRKGEKGEISYVLDKSSRGKFLEIPVDSFCHVLIMDGQQTNRLKEQQEWIRQKEEWLEQQKKEAAHQGEYPFWQRRMEEKLKKWENHLLEEKEFCFTLNDPRHKKGIYEREDETKMRIIYKNKDLQINR